MTVRDPSGERGGGTDAVTIGVLCRADEPALAATLESLERASRPLVAQGRRVSLAVCVNGEEGRRALDDARTFASRSAGLPATVIVEPRADKARAWNAVRSSCQTPLLGFCDADVEVDPLALRELVDALDAHPEILLASARQVPDLDGASFVARAAALPYRFDFGVVGGRLYVMRPSAVARMPEGLLLEDGWLSAEIGRARLRTVETARVGFHPPRTMADYFRERLRTEAGKVQIRSGRRSAGRAAEPIASYPWREMRRRMRPADLPLLAVNLAVRGAARAVAEVAARRGRQIHWATVATSKPAGAAGGER